MKAEVHKSPEQLLLNWPVREIFSEVDFLPSSSNEAAVRWIDSWPNWQRGEEDFHCLIIYGAEGCGKTHLAHIWQKISDAQIIRIEELKTLNFSVGDQFVYIIEDIDNKEISEKEAEALLHLYNWLKEQGGFLLLTASKRPKKWNLKLADLSSRLLASEAVKINSPDDDLLRSVIIKQFSDRQIILSDKVVSYIIKYADRSFSSVRDLVRELDILSMSEKKKITVPLVKRVLAMRGEK